MAQLRHKLAESNKRRKYRYLLNRSDSVSTHGMSAWHAEFVHRIINTSKSFGAHEPDFLHSNNLWSIIAGPTSCIRFYYRPVPVREAPCVCRVCQLFLVMSRIFWYDNLRHDLMYSLLKVDRFSVNSGEHMKMATVSTS